MGINLLGISDKKTVAFFLKRKISFH